MINYIPRRSLNLALGFSGGGAAASSAGGLAGSGALAPGGKWKKESVRP